MKDLILTAIKKNSPITYTELENRAAKRGLSLDELDELLLKVHKDKRVKKTVKDGDIVYTWEEPKDTLVPSHILWLRDNYPRPAVFEMAFPEIDMSWIILSPEDMVRYKEEMKGKPAYVNTRRKNTKKNT